MCFQRNWPSPVSLQGPVSCRSVSRVPCWVFPFLFILGKWISADPCAPLRCLTTLCPSQYPREARIRAVALSLICLATQAGLQAAAIRSPRKPERDNGIISHLLLHEPFFPRPHVPGQPHQPPSSAPRALPPAPCSSGLAALPGPHQALGHLTAFAQASRALVGPLSPQPVS